MELPSYRSHHYSSLLKLYTEASFVNRLQLDTNTIDNLKHHLKTYLTHIVWQPTVPSYYMSAPTFQSNCRVLQLYSY